MVVGSKGPAAPTGPESPAGPIDDKAHRPSKRGPGRQLLVPAALEAAGMESLGLGSRILETVQALGIETFTEPQERAIPRILAGANVLLVAPTGIGKTEAALLPILDRIPRDKPEPTSCLYITPLRALNRDMLRRMTFFADRLGVRVAVRHGDTTPQERAAITRHPPDILITTPETFQILFTGRKLREHLRSVRYVVVDEIHELASDERVAQLAVALERLRDLTGREFQRIGLSATVGAPAEVASFLGGVDRPVEVIRVRIPKGIRIRIEMPATEQGDSEIAERLRVKPGQAAALRRCYELIKEHQSTLFFVNTRDTAEFLSSRLAAWYQDPKIGVHHGSLSKDVRVQMEDEFKSGGLRALVCTSSLELGIDVGTADFVLQYNSPREVSRLVQRIGRSGHGVGEVSDGVILATHEDDVAEACAIARRALAEEIEDLVVRKDNRSVLANQLVALAVSERFASLDEAYETFRRSWPFRELKRAEFDEVVAQLAGLRILWSRDGRLGRSSNSLPYFFENISMIPDVKTYRVIDLSSRPAIGTLDEWFVAENAKLGESFIMRGSAWRFVDFKEDHLLVEPVREIGDVPSWVGEDIPVPFDVAQEVGRIRKERDLSAYPVNEHGKSTFLAYLGSVGDAPLATDTRITIESARDVLIVNACFGSKVNETLVKVFWERMDIPRTVEVLRRIQSGAIEIVVTRMTPIGRAGLEGGRLLVTPSRADHATLMAVKARLEKETATFLCLNCKMSWRDVVRDLPAKIRCPKCEGLMVAVIAPYEKDKIAKLDLQGTDKESRAKAKRLFTNASLVMAHGRKAVLALMARGVGEDTAARILRGYHETELDFLRDVLAAEITYARTKRFWD